MIPVCRPPRTRRPCKVAVRCCAAAVAGLIALPSLAFVDDAKPDADHGRSVSMSARASNVPDGKEAWSPAVASQVGPTSLREFGAKGDGTADDSKAIQRWLDACTARRTACYAPAGRYLMNEQVKLTGVIGFVLRGDGALATVFIAGKSLAGRSVFLLSGVAHSVFKMFAIHGRDEVRAHFPAAAIELRRTVAE